MSEFQFYSLLFSNAAVLITIVAHARKSEKRSTRMEVFLKLCCVKLKIPTDQL